MSYIIFLGIIANNPTLDILTEIAEYNLALRSVDRNDEVVDPEVILSLGTGVPPMRKVCQMYFVLNHQIFSLKILKSICQIISKFDIFLYRQQLLTFLDQIMHWIQQNFFLIGMEWES